MKIEQKETKQTRRGGFTLVELLLVLVILGILAAIVVPKFSGHSERARIQAAYTQIKAFETMLNNYEVDVGQYPKSLTDLIVQPRDANNWHGPYLQADAIPKDPWNHDYAYRAPGAHNPSFFDLSSEGPAGGDTLIANWTVKK